VTAQRRNDSQRDAWDRLADGWAELVRTGTDHNRVHVLDPATLAILGDVAGKRVLDAGCGEGRFARMLAQRGARVTAVDLSSRMIELARQEEQKNPLGIDYHVADIRELSLLPAAEFDIALAYVCLVDVEEYEAAIAQIARVVRPGGQFVFSITHPCFTMPGAEWESRVPDSFRDADRLYRKVDNYFPARETPLRMWPRAPAEVVNYHRPLSEYAHALRDSGFLIRDLVEPTPDPKLAEQLDFWRGYFRIALFIIFDAVKAGQQ